MQLIFTFLWIKLFLIRGRFNTESITVYGEKYIENVGEGPGRLFVVKRNILLSGTQWELGANLLNFCPLGFLC